MSKLLKDVVDYLKETAGLSMSQISKDLGKNRNYIREAIERDISMEKQIEIIEQLPYRFLGCTGLMYIIQQQATKYQVAQEQVDVVNEENRKLEKHCASLKTTLEHRNKGLSEANRTIEKMGQELKRKLDNSDRLYCESQSQRKHLEQRLCNATAKNKELEHQIVVLQKKIDEDQMEYVKGEVAQDKEIERLQELLIKEQEGMEQVNETIDSLRTVCTELGIDANNWQRTSKLWKLLFIMASIFLLALALYHAF